MPRRLMATAVGADSFLPPFSALVRERAGQDQHSLRRRAARVRHHQPHAGPAQRPHHPARRGEGQEGGAVLQQGVRPPFQTHHPTLTFRSQTCRARTSRSATRATTGSARTASSLSRRASPTPSSRYVPAIPTRERGMGWVGSGLLPGARPSPPLNTPLCLCAPPSAARPAGGGAGRVRHPRGGHAAARARHRQLRLAQQARVLPR